MTAGAGPDEADTRRRFIVANTTPMAPPLVPEIVLHLAHEALPLWQKTEEELTAIGLPPPFWAFAWAGGQALARYLLDHPALARGRNVLDLGTGSGLVAIAAAKAGATHVLASDLDPFAVAAIGINAAANGEAIEATCRDLIGCDEGWDLVLVGDAFYERPLAQELLPWLEALAQRGADVLIGDPGRAYLPKHRLVERAVYEVPVTRELEDAEIKRTAVWTVDRSCEMT